MEMCTSCWKEPANHEVYRWWEAPEKQNLCCKCHIKDDGDPCDWHPSCMKHSRKLESEVVR